MRLTDISFRAGSEIWLHELNLAVVEGEINVLLGATLAGKTTLLRIMAGLDRPATGRVWIGSRDVTRVPVRERSVAMVYQQFINYPSLTVYENIASPLRVARKRDAEIRSRVAALAQTLHLTPFLSRYPAELSGGQQQRTALARALARDADLLLLDEPLVNLDYKLREEFRDELMQLFAQRGTTVVYATTEPQEALQLGGHTAVLAGGRLLQSGPATQVFRRPATLAAARAFSNPPLNVLTAKLDPACTAARLDDGVCLPLPPYARLPQSSNDIVLGIRAHELSLSRSSAAQTAIRGQVDLVEISGSDTYVHVMRHDGSLVAQVPGVHNLALDAVCAFYIDPARLYGFDAGGQLLFAPEH